MAMTQWSPRVAIILSIVALTLPGAAPTSDLVTKETKLESWNWNYYARSWAHLGSVQSLVLVKEHDYVQEHDSPLCHQEGANATFGFHGATTWVKDGCRGDFTVTLDTADTTSAKYDTLAAMLKDLDDETELLESTLEFQNATISELTNMIEELVNRAKEEPKVKPDTPEVSISNSGPITDRDGVRLACSTTTPGITSYQFLLDGVILADSATDSYTIPSATIGTHDGSVTCIASIDTSASDESSPTTLELVPRTPTIGSSPTSGTLNAGTALTFTCKTISVSSAIKYTFMWGSRAVRSVTTSTIGEYGAFTISSLVALDSGDWTCKATINGVVSGKSTKRTLTVN